MADMVAGKLNIELIPQPLWGKNLRSTLIDVEWDLIRHEVYRRANYTCEICGGKGPKHPVECHEKWHYNDRKKIQKLVGFLALCPLCHKVKHYGRFQKVLSPRELDLVIQHAQKVNDWSDAEWVNHLVYSQTQWMRRSGEKWEVDLSYAKEFVEELE